MTLRSGEKITGKRMVLLLPNSRVKRRKKKEKDNETSYTVTSTDETDEPFNSCTSSSHIKRVSSRQTEKVKKDNNLFAHLKITL